ncbi:peptidase [Mesorhizobium sp. LSJC265A00]|uniref:superinfection immunity protein n=1 Tax=Mesorhizobium sp. LSJC265A00 TaxID=1287322 RepID=UPI0003CED8B3|nr:superinfection immunity protein [Mesorhizobium sp. LSJC265A00]ESX09920.1 peptidase [Mesorhizobium sp. LSJC265A00]
MNLRWILSGFPTAAATVLASSPAWAARDDQNLGAGTAAIAVIMLLAAVVYELPAIIAFMRGHPNRWLILVLCTALAGTGVVWLGCLVWAFMAVHISKEPSGSNGGESGLNLAANDVQKVLIENPLGLAQLQSPLSPSDPVDKLERLKRLFDDGAIDRAQFERLRALIIGG